MGKKNLFDDGTPTEPNDNPTDMRGEHPDLQRQKPMSSPARVIVQRMRDGYDLVQPQGSKPVLMRLGKLDLIQTNQQFVQELVNHGFIEILPNTMYARAGWLCYGLSPSGRKYAQ